MGYNTTTVCAEHVPLELRIPAIQRGYRLPYKHWRYYFQSIFHVHNETVNVWTHLIGLIVIAYQVFVYFRFYSAEGSDLCWTVLGFGTCCCITLLNSAVAHLLHSKSRYTNYIIFMYDYLGVVFWGFGTAYLAVYGVSDKEWYIWVGPNFILLQLIFTYINFINICTSKLWFGHDLAHRGRQSMIVSGITMQGLCNFLPWFPRYITCYQDPGCEISSMNHITAVLFSFFVMGLTFVLHQPEKSCPSTFDIVGQSHQIFHVTVIITQSLQLRALYVDFINESNTHCHPDIYHTVGYICALILAGALTIVFSGNKVKQVLQQNKHKNKKN